MVHPEMHPKEVDPLLFHPVGVLTEQVRDVLTGVFFENGPVMQGAGLVMTVDVCDSSGILESNPRAYQRLMNCVRAPFRSHLFRKELPPLALWTDAGDGWIVCMPRTISHDGYYFFDQDVSIGRALYIARLCAWIIAEERGTTLGSATALSNDTGVFSEGQPGRGGLKIAITGGDMHFFRSFGIGFGGIPCHQGARMGKAVSTALGMHDPYLWSHGVVFTVPQNLITPEARQVAEMMGLVQYTSLLGVSTVGPVQVMIPRYEPAFHPGAAAEIAEIIQ